MRANDKIVNLHGKFVRFQEYLTVRQFTMKQFFVFIFIVLCNMPAALSQPADTLWNRANQSYQNGNYEESSALYEQILNESGESSSLYFNLGNAYLKQNMTGKARLNYERALRLDPENPDVIYNINFAKSMQMDKIEEVKEVFLSLWFNNVANVLSMTGWTIAFIGLLSLCLILLLLYFFTRSLRIRKLSFISACFVLLLVAVSFVFGNKRKYNQIKEDEAVIFAPVVTVKSSPNTSGADLFIIHEGLKVKVLDTEGNWIRIMLSDGKSQGWAPKESMEII